MMVGLAKYTVKCLFNLPSARLGGQQLAADFIDPPVKIRSPSDLHQPVLSYEVDELLVFLFDETPRTL